METIISVFLKDYKCYVVEQSGRAKGTKYKAYGQFDNHFLEAQGSNPNSALKRLEQKAKIALD